MKEARPSTVGESCPMVRKTGGWCALENGPHPTEVWYDDWPLSYPIQAPLYLSGILFEGTACMRVD